MAVSIRCSRNEGILKPVPESRRSGKTRQAPAADLLWHLDGCGRSQVVIEGSGRAEGASSLRRPATRSRWSLRRAPLPRPAMYNSSLAGLLITPAMIAPQADRDRKLRNAMQEIAGASQQALGTSVTGGMIAVVILARS
jgi:hypothetical protein